MSFSVSKNTLKTALVALGMAVSAASMAAGKPAEVDRYIELNHTITDGMQTYPGLSEADYYTVAPRFGNGALVDGIKLLGITGTYLDAPYHGDEHGETIADYPLERLVNVPIVVVTKPDSRQTFEVADLKGLDVKGKAVMFASGHSDKFNTPEYANKPPYLSVATAQWLVDHGASMVGIDTPLVDNIDKSETIPVHHLLLEHKIIIIEDMANLTALPKNGAYLTAVPPRVELASFPARVFATVYK